MILKKNIYNLIIIKHEPFIKKTFKATVVLFLLSFVFFGFENQDDEQTSPFNCSELQANIGPLVTFNIL